MTSKRFAVFSGWADLVKNPPTIEEMEVSGANRHRRECFEVAKKLTHLHSPNNEEDFSYFMEEYIRQLMGPEIYDAYSSPRPNTNVAQMFRIIRKYTLGV